MIYRYFLYLLKLGVQNIFLSLPLYIRNFKSEKAKIKINTEDLNKIYTYKKNLLSDDTEVAFTEYGAGMKNKKKFSGSIKNIASLSATTSKNGKLLYSFVQIYNPEVIMELGTSLGIGALYMSYASSNARLITIEGNQSIQNYAIEEFNKQQIKNVEFVNANFNLSFETLLKKNSTLKTMVFIDGNHKFETTIRYFELCIQYLVKDSVIIIDDINWSSGMFRAWKQIIKNNNIKYSINFYYLGCLILGEKLKNENYYLIR